MERAIEFSWKKNADTAESLAGEVGQIRHDAHIIDYIAGFKRNLYIPDQWMLLATDLPIRLRMKIDTWLAAQRQT
jgi:hypothetical protein